MIRHRFVAVGMGPTGCGKSRLLSSYARPFPRRIIIDFVGEYVDDPDHDDALVGTTLDQCLAHMKNAAISGGKWKLICCISPDDVPALLDVLAPPGDLAGGYARNVGGVALECGEVDVIAPNNASISDEMRNVIQRGRHYRVSILGASQRPAQVSRLLTAQADVLSLFRQYEPRDIAYLREATNDEVANRLPNLPKFWHVQYLVKHGSARVVDANYRTVEEFDAWGRRVDASATRA